MSGVVDWLVIGLIGSVCVCSWWWVWEVEYIYICTHINERCNKRARYCPKLEMLAMFAW